MSRHETFLAVKAYENDEGRFITGWATTPAKDLVSDVVIPEGAQFSLPIPLLFAHKHDEPIGAVTEATVTKAGIRIRAKLTAGVSRAEEAWKLIKDGALSAVSIGFSALKATPIAGGGTRFDSWLWHELSLCAVGANPEARIVVGKAIAYASAEPKKAVEPPRPVYVPHHDIRKDFEGAEKCLPGKPVSIFRSTKHGDHWHLRDDDGALLGIVPPLPDRKPKAPVRSPAKNQNAQAITSKGLEIFSDELGKILGEQFSGLKKRIAELEHKASMTDGAMKYLGSFNEALPYQRSSVVKHGGSAFIALRDIQPAKAPPNRDGSGWARLTD